VYVASYLTAGYKLLRVAVGGSARYLVTLMEENFENFVVSLSGLNLDIYFNLFINVKFFQYILKTTSVNDLHYFHDILRRTNRVVFLEVLHKP